MTSILNTTSRLLRSAKQKSGAVAKLSVRFEIVVHAVNLPVGATGGTGQALRVFTTIERGPKVRVEDNARPRRGSASFFFPATLPVSLPLRKV